MGNFTSHREEPEYAAGLGGGEWLLDSMVNIEELAKRRTAAGDEFSRHEDRADGPQVAASLSSGLTVLRDALYARVHDDVERRLGMDSMLMPVSEEKTQRVARLEIELYQIVVSAATVAERSYVKTNDEWFLKWLSQLRVGSVHADSRVTKRLAYYQAKAPSAQQLAFSNILAAALPESRRAPLVLFRLVAPAVQIVTGLAFGDRPWANRWRDRQAEDLPAIRDCSECRGKLLENGRQCPVCGNPLWKFDWLTAAD